MLFRNVTAAGRLFTAERPNSAYGLLLLVTLLFAQDCVFKILYYFQKNALTLKRKVKNQLNKLAGQPPRNSGFYSNEVN